MAKRKIDEQISYNWLFLLLAGLFSFVTFWAVYDEAVSRREWKQYQERFFEIETDLAKAELERAEAYLDVAECPKACFADAVTDECGASPDAKCVQKLESSRAKIEDECRANACAPAARLAELEAQRASIQEDLRGPRAEEIKALEAELSEINFEEFDKNQNWTFTKAEWSEQDYYFRLARHAHLANPDDGDAKAAYEEQLAVVEELRARTAEEGALVDDVMARRKEIEARLAKARRAEELTAVEKEIEKIKLRQAEAKRVYDTAKGKQGGLFGAATAVNQYDLPEIGKVDRCNSCHLGTTRGGFEEVAEVEFRSHTFRRTLLGIHDPDKFGCTTCHDGQGTATIKFFAHAPGMDEDVHAFHKHYWEFPVLKGPPGGDGTEYMESKCRSCHQEQTELRSTITCELDVECAPLVTSEPGEKPDVVCDVPALMERVAAQHAFDTLPGTPEEALPKPKDNGGDEVKMCVDRRKKTPLLVDLAPNYTKGVKMVEEAGCYGCHPIAGFENLPKPAPSLTRAAIKLDPGYMVSWIQNPKLHRADTRMPKFWPELDNPDVYPFPVDVQAETARRASESRAMAAYLLDVSQKTEKYPYELEAMPAGLVGDVARGNQLFSDRGCMGCHDHPEGEDKSPKRKNRASHFDHGPDLRDIGAKTTREWIYSWIRDPRRYSPTARMPDLRLTPQEALDIATFLSTLKGEKTFDRVAMADLADPALIEEGKALVKKYGCYGCHLVEGYENEPGIGADLSAFGVKLPERLDFGDYITDHNQQSWDAWTINKLRHPRVYSYTGQSPVETRMPEFGFTEDEVRALMVFLRSNRGGVEIESKVLRHELTDLEKRRERGRTLVRMYNCYGCHEVDGHDGELAEFIMAQGDDPNVPNSIKRPPPLTQQGFKTQPGWLFRFLKHPFRMRPQTPVRMPTFGFSDEEANTLVAMFSSLDGVPYPFTDYADVKPADEGEYRVGKALFDAAGCQKCHVVGELGEGPAPYELKAPDLMMAGERLRAQWLDLWLANPSPLQPKTAMPSFWGGGNQMEMFMGNPEFTGAIQGIDPEVIRAFLSGPQAQIQAVRNFLFTMKKPGPLAAAQ